MCFGGPWAGPGRIFTNQLNYGDAMSEATNNPAIVGGLAGAVGLFLGGFLSLTTLNTKVADGLDATQTPVAETLAEQSNAIAALADRLAAIETGVADNATTVGALGDALAGMGETVTATANGLAEQVGSIAGQVEGSVATAVGGIGDQLSDLRDSLSTQIDETASAQGEALQMALANLPAATPAAEAKPEEASAAAPQETQEEEPAFVSAGDLGDGGDSFAIGQTALFADGGVRAFVQRMDTEAARATLFINDVSQSIGAGESVVARHTDGACRVGVSGMSDAGVAIVSDCDADVAGGELGDAFTPGNTVAFADDTLRVFVSGVVNGDARLAFNGLDTQLVGIGQPVEVEAGDSICTVHVHGVRGSHVALSADCG